MRLSTEKAHLNLQICRSVCDGGQIVWANSNVAEGLVENSKVRLATAVGMPICSVGGNLCVIVLFATQPIPMTPNAVEFLCSMARAATGLDNTSGFASSPYSCTPSPSYAKTDQFRGVWDISERLNSTYSAAIDFHLLPIKRLQAFFDFQEVTSFNDLFGNDAATHPIKITGQYDFSPFDDFSPSQSSWSAGHANAGSETDDTQWINANFHHSRVRTVSEVTVSETKEIPTYNSLTADALTMTDLSNQRKSGSLTVSTSQDANSCCSSEIDEDEELSDASSLEFVFEDDVSRGPSSPLCLPSPKGFRTAVQIDARTSFRTNQSRFHEFMDAILGLTHFDCAELWLLSDRSSELYVVSALHGDEAAHAWTMQSKGMRLRKGMDVPGIVYETGRPHWDKHYDTRHLRRASRKLKKDYSPNTDTTFNANPRSELASKMGMCTAFGVPLPGPTGGISGVLALYSRVKMEPDPLLLTLVHKSVQLMSSNASTIRTVPSYSDIDNYKDNHQSQNQNYYQHNNNLIKKNNSQNNLNLHHELPSISENPYSFFCQNDQLNQQQYQHQSQSQLQSQQILFDDKWKQLPNTFPFIDYSLKDKLSVDIPLSLNLDNITCNGYNNSQNTSNQSKRGWMPINQNQHLNHDQNQNNMSGANGHIHRTVSANELILPSSQPHPHPIFHSHSMPDSMYLESSYLNLEVPKSKRARSIDLGSGSSSHNILGPIPIPQGGRQNVLIPSGVEVFDHMDLHWSSLTKPYDMKNILSNNNSYPLINNDNNNNNNAKVRDNFGQINEGTILMQNNQQHHQYIDFQNETDDHSRLQQQMKRSQQDLLRQSYQYEIPSLQPVVKCDFNQNQNQNSNLNQNVPNDNNVTMKTQTKSKKNNNQSSLQHNLSLQNLNFENSSLAASDQFNSDLTFTNDFSFNDHELLFNSNNNYSSSSVEEPSSPPAVFPPCRVDGCDADSSHRSPFCVVHAAGGRRCQQEGCNKCAQVRHYII